MAKKRKAIETKEDATPSKHPDKLEIDLDEIIIKVAKGDPNKLRLKDLVKQQLATIDHSPDHPVYPVMIQEAITDLNEEGGSTKEAISQFIVGKYDVLRVVHLPKLIEQLEKLVNRKEIALTSENRYMLPLENTSSVAKSKVVKKSLSKDEQDGRSYNHCKIGGEEGKMQEDQNANDEEKYNSQIKEFNRTPGFRFEVSVSQNLLQEEQRHRVTEKFLEDNQKKQLCTQMFEGTQDDELDEPPGFQIRGFESQNCLNETQMRVSEFQGLEVASGQFCQLIGGGQQNVIEEVAFGQDVQGVNDERPVGQIQDQDHMKETEATEEPIQVKEQELNVIEDQMDVETQAEGKMQPSVELCLDVEEHCRLDQTNIETIEIQEEEMEVSKEQIPKRSAEQFSQGNECWPKVIEEEACEEHFKRFDNERHVEEIQAHEKYTQAIEELSQVQDRAPKAIEDREEPESQIKDRTKPLVLQNLPAEGYFHPEQMHIQAIGTKKKLQEQEVEHIIEQKGLQEHHDEMGNKTADFSERNTSEPFSKRCQEYEAMAAGSLKASKKLDNDGSLLSLLPSKEKFIDLWKRKRIIEQELRDIIDCLSAVDVPKHHSSEPVTRIVLGVPESDPKTASHCVDASTYLMQSDQIEHHNLKRTPEVGIMALEGHKKQGKMCSLEEALKSDLKSIVTSSDKLLMKLNLLVMEKQKFLFNFEHCLELHGSQKPPESQLVATSPNATMEYRVPDLEHQPELSRSVIQDLQAPQNSERLELEQQLHLPEPEKSLQNYASAVEEEVLTSHIFVDTRQVEQEETLEIEQYHEISLEKMHPEVKLTTAEKSSQVEPHQATSDEVHNYESKLLKDQQVQMLDDQQHSTVEMNALEEQCQMKQQIQGEQRLHPQGQRLCDTESVRSADMHDCQLQNSEKPQDHEVETMDESSQTLKQKEGESGARKQSKIELPRRQLRPRGPKPSEFAPANALQPLGSGPLECVLAGITEPKNLDLSISSMGLEKNKKLKAPVQKRPREEEAEKLEEFSEPQKQELDHHFQQKMLNHNLAAITSDEVQIPENSAHVQPTEVEDLDQAQKQQLQQPDETTAESLVSQHLNEKKDKPRDGRGRPRKLKPQESANMKKIVDSNMGKAPLDHQNNNKLLPRKDGRGRPRKLKIPSEDESVDLALPSMLGEKQLPQDEGQRMSPESKPTSGSTTVLGLFSLQRQALVAAGGQGRITRSRAAAIEATISPLPPAKTLMSTKKTLGKRMDLVSSQF